MFMLSEEYRNSVLPFQYDQRVLKFSKALVKMAQDSCALQYLSVIPGAVEFQIAVEESQ